MLCKCVKGRLCPGTINSSSPFFCITKALGSTFDSYSSSTVDANEKWNGYLRLSLPYNFILQLDMDLVMPSQYLHAYYWVWLSVHTEAVPKSFLSENLYYFRPIDFLSLLPHNNSHSRNITYSVMHTCTCMYTCTQEILINLPHTELKQQHAKHA